MSSDARPTRTRRSRRGNSDDVKRSSFGKVIGWSSKLIRRDPKNCLTRRLIFLVRASRDNLQGIIR
jgi:hypothetical protein